MQLHNLFMFNLPSESRTDWLDDITQSLLFQFNEKGGEHPGVLTQAYGLAGHEYLV